MMHEFESLESAHDFVKLLAETVAEAKRDLESDVQRESAPSRRLDALRIARYNLSKLETHVAQTSRLLNDLRTLRRLLFEERQNRSYQDNRAPAQVRQPQADAPTSPINLRESVAA
jgi:hypothetical protein